MSKKVVILGNTNLGYSWFVLTTHQGCVLNGCDVANIDFKSNSLSDIRDTIIRLNPDIVFTHLSFHGNKHPVGNTLQMYKDVKKKIDVKFIHTLGDARKQDRYMGDVSDIFHSAFVSNLDCIDICKNAWKTDRVYYNPYSSLVYNKIAEPKIDLNFGVVFTGSPGAHKDRSEFIRKLTAIMDIRIFKTQTKDDLRHRTDELSASTECILGLCTGYDIRGYIDVRPFQYLGTGACMIIRKFNGMDEVMPDNLYYPITSYNNPHEVKEIYEKFIKNKPNKRMRNRAFKYIQKYHSCKERMKNVLNIIDEKQDSVKALRKEFE